MGRRTYASLALILVTSIGMPALAETNLRIVNATSGDIEIGHGDGNMTVVPAGHYAPRHLPVLIGTKGDKDVFQAIVVDLHKNCTGGDAEVWDIATYQSFAHDPGGPWESSVHHFCIKLSAEYGCLLAEVRPDHIAYSKVADTECVSSQ